jgi:hypothetical protein
LIGSTADQPPKEALEKATMINIKCDFDERKFRREVEKAAQEGVDEAAKKLTRDIDRLRLQYQGRPVDTIKPALKRLFERRGGKLTRTRVDAVCRDGQGRHQDRIQAREVALLEFWLECRLTVRFVSGWYLLFAGSVRWLTPL